MILWGLNKHVKNRKNDKVINFVTGGVSKLP